jgi:transcriptional antiterminator NusG
VTAGPFANQVGKIDSIDSDKEVLRVLVEMFGRETPAELTFDEIDADI